MKKRILTLASFKNCVTENIIPEEAVIAFEINNDVYVITTVTFMTNGDPSDELLLLSGEKVQLKNCKNHLTKHYSN